MTKNSFTFHYVIGRGGFGKVCHVFINHCVCLGMASGEEKDWLNVCNERNVKSTHHHQAISKLSNERTQAARIA